MQTIIRNLGICDYQKIWKEMREFTETRNKNTPDEIWLLEHYPVFTLGFAGKKEHILNPGAIPVVKTDRGGQVTYHGPGQLVAYFLIDLRRRKLGVKQFVNILENTVIKLLSDYGVTAYADPQAPGIYVDQKKICSIGLKICNGCSYHGIAFNIDMELKPFSRINPCGYKNLQMTRLKDFVPNITMGSYLDTLQLSKLLGYQRYEAYFGCHSNTKR